MTKLPAHHSTREPPHRRLMRCSQSAAWVVAALGMLGLLGCTFDGPVLKSLLFGFMDMKANTALGFLLLGTAAAHLHRSASDTSRRMTQFIALAVSLLGALTLAEYVLHWNLRIDPLLFGDSPGSSAAQFSARMSPFAALDFMLLGSALTILASQRQALQRVGDVLTYVAGLLGFLSLVCALYGASALYRGSVFSPIGPRSASMFVVIAIALLTASPLRGVAALLAGDNVGTILARKLLPVALLVPPLVGYLRLLGQKHGLYGTEFGPALFATANVVILALIIYSVAASLRRTDLERRDSERALYDSEQRLRLLINNAQDYATLMLDLDGRIDSWNEGAQRLIGYSAPEILGEHFSRFYTAEELVINKPAQALVRARAEGVSEDEGWRVRKDGSRYWAHVVIVALKDEDGELRGFGKITHDCTDRKRIEEARRESEQRLRHITDSLTSGLVIATLDGQIFHWNNAAVAIFGFGNSAAWLRKLPELLQTFELATLDGRVLELEEWPLARVIAGEKLRNLEVAWRRVDVACQGVLSFSGDIVVEDSGRSVAFLSFADVTERKRHETELKQTNERFAIASEAAGLGFWDFNIGSNTLRWDDQMFALYGRSRITGELPYSVWIDSLHPEDRQRSEQELIDAIQGTRDFHTEFRIVHPDGSIRHLKASARVARDSEGHSVRMMGVNIDITERKRTELDLRESEQRYRFLAEAMPQIIWLAKPDGNLDYYNQQWYGYTGLTFEQTRDWGWKAVVHPDDLQNSIDRWTEAVTTGNDYEIECRLKRGADGAYRWHLGRAFPRRDLHGAIIQWVGSCTDIDDQKRSEAELREAYTSLERRVIERTMELSATKAQAERANEAKSEFLANMSHEIRTPLNAVIGLGYLLEQTTLTDDQRQFLGKIQFAGRSLLSVVNNVLDLSKIEAGEMSLEDQSFELPKLLLDISQMLVAQATAKGIELILKPASDLPRLVIGDASRLRQILTNLLHNAIKFTDAGRVELRAYCTEQGSERIRLRCEVLDTGIGIDPAAIKRMFTPFAQADASTTRRFGGTGLGLSIARHLVGLMGGEIDATSTVAAGSTFWIEIPLRIARSVDSTLSTQGLRITVADSDAAGSLPGLVRALGWSPQVVSTGEELLTFLGRAQPDTWPHVLITQLHLSDMDAHQLIDRLQNESGHGEMPSVIMVTDSAHSYLMHQPRLRRSDVLLEQPFSSSALFNAINAAVSGRPGAREYLVQPSTDVLNAQWLIGVRMLVVDDSGMNREVAQGILENQGAIVSICTDGRKAVEYVRAHHHELDVVLMDVQMPIMDGNEATRLIRSELNLQNLPIIGLTAGALASERQRALQAGMNDIVTKPFDPSVLIRQVRSHVERTRSQPIPMAIIDRKPVLPLADELLIPSIDAAVVRQMFGEDFPLFKSSLSRMLRDYVDFAVPIAVPLDDPGARGQLKARLHKLRGSAGLIGATRIMRLAGLAENALHERRTIDVVRPMLEQLTSAFSDMYDEAQLWLTRQAERETASGAEAAPRPSISTAEVDELYALLDTRNLAALDKFSLLSASLSELLGAPRFDRLRDAMDNLDFQLGARLLRESRSTMAA